jgi:acylglycerol lipase
MRPVAGLVALLACVLALLACAHEAPLAEAGSERLPRRAWLPAGEPRAVVLAVHGFNDYSNAFAEFGVFARNRGVAVYAYDQPGFGANPDAGRWPGTAAITGTLRAEAARLAARHPDRPLFLLGESMGAAVVMATVAEGPLPGVQGVILSAPAVWGGDQLNLFYRAVLWLTSNLVPGLEVTGDGLDVMASDNIEVLRALAADPLFIKATRIDALAGLVALMDAAVADVGGVDGPLLVLMGAKDEVVPPEAQEAIVEQLAARPCLAVTYPDGYHMLLRDLQRRVVSDDILAWIEGQSLPSGLERDCGGSVTPVAAARS